MKIFADGIEQNRGPLFGGFVEVFLAAFEILFLAFEVIGAFEAHIGRKLVGQTLERVFFGLNLSPQPLQGVQCRAKLGLERHHLLAVFIDEFTKRLGVDDRNAGAAGDDCGTGGSVVMAGDTGRLPPTGGRRLNARHANRGISCILHKAVSTTQSSFHKAVSANVRPEAGRKTHHATLERSPDSKADDATFFNDTQLAGVKDVGFRAGVVGKDQAERNL